MLLLDWKMAWKSEPSEMETKLYSNWDFVANAAFQEEVIESLMKTSDDYNIDEIAREKVVESRRSSSACVLS